MLLRKECDEIMDTLDKLKDVKHDLVKLERDIAFSGGRGVNYENEHHED